MVKVVHGGRSLRLNQWLGRLIQGRSDAAMLKLAQVGQEEAADWLKEII